MTDSLTKDTQLAKVYLKNGTWVVSDVWGFETAIGESRLLAEEIREAMESMYRAGRSHAFRDLCELIGAKHE